MDIELPSQIDIDQYEDMIGPFLKAVLNYEEDFLVTDLSRVTDFMEIDFEGPSFNSLEEAHQYEPSEEEKERHMKKFRKKRQRLMKKIHEVCRVDVSDIEDLNLAKVLHRIRVIKGM